MDMVSESRGVFEGPRTACPRDRTLVELFEHQVSERPEAAALRHDGREMTYRQLNRRANRLARSLRARGVRVDQPVGLLFDRTPETIVGLLGILKAGGAYLPLDPADPAAHLQQVMVEARLGIVVGDHGRAYELGLDVPVVEVSRDPADASDDVNVPGGAGPTDLAYVIFTNGSVGRPRGVCVPHRGVLRLVIASEPYRLRPEDRVLQATSLAFDVAALEIWGALLNGGCLCLISRDTLRTPARLQETLARERISVAAISTPLFHQLAATVPAAFTGLRLLVIAGDVVDPRWVRRVLEEGPPGQLINGYGPTECSVLATAHPVAELPPAGAAIPIGRAMPYTRLCVLDEARRPVGPGETGELYVGGDGLARGYLHRPKLTAEHFIDDPFEAGGRLYRTGDRVRYRPDGTLELLGRVDRQVKIRGVRIEPGEIERTRKGASASTAALRAVLASRLPGFMVPHAPVVLGALPLNPNVKADLAHRPMPRHVADE